MTYVIERKHVRVDHRTGDTSEEWKVTGKIHAKNEKAALRSAKNRLCRTEHSSMRVKLWPAS